MLVKFSKKFSKQYEKSDKKVKSAFDNKLTVFLQNPFDSLLNNHQLVGKFISFRSINITGDWRALYSEYVDDEGSKIIIFEVLGTHSQLYK